MGSGAQLAFWGNLTTKEFFMGKCSDDVRERNFPGEVSSFWSFFGERAF